MKYIQKPLTNLVTLHNGKIGRSILTTKPVEIKDLQGLKYIPQQLPTDIVEISPQISARVSQETLQNLVNKNLTLQEISDTLSIPISTIRHYLRKYNISRFPEEITALKKYFSTTDPKEKAKAYEVIDKHLQKMAEKEAKVRKEPFEDCLQDIRIRFLEHASRKGKDRSVSVYRILDLVEESAPAPATPIEKVSLKSITNKMETTDKTTDMFEESNLTTYLLNNSNLSSQEKAVMILDMKKETPINEISKTFYLSTARINQIIKKALFQIKEYNFNESGEFIEKMNPYKLELPCDETAIKTNLMENSNFYHSKNSF